MDSVLDERQQSLLTAIIQQYIKTAEPVGSKFVAEAGRFAVSPATIRNLMVELEDAGYLYQPHISAGRVPTEKGYQWYISTLDHGLDVSRRQNAALQQALKPAGQINPAKQLARAVADLSASTVFVGFSTSDFYYTGLSNLFAQPEFSDQDLVCQLSEVIDQFDQVIERLLTTLKDDVVVLIGHDNPFGHGCSVVVGRYSRQRAGGVFGILGPQRMDYSTNIILVEYCRQLMETV